MVPNTRQAEAQGHDRPIFPVSLYHPIVGSSERDSIDYNCLWRVSESAWQQLREQAACTQRALQSSAESCFKEVFMTPKPFFQRFDLYFHVPLLLTSSVESSYCSAVGEDGASGVAAASTASASGGASLAGEGVGGVGVGSASAVAACVRALLQRALGTEASSRATSVQTMVCMEGANR